ncbi:DUF2786 domain-containing protein [Microbacterium schleiferi]|uniref:DUF2786 domain-containing protein n=1 Tax=Microbacterium schleiferi TaxID=69362 RepID=A0A7S8MVT3_9MICO|nr:DUF2786 domain-containing protein [Microbacterium schleiferi]QPE04152.1 DUF2786 domain-containing protein [Microbacterium schleiferi]
MNDRKLETIARLLAKAESTSTEEAKALTEHAQRLMVKYGIEQAHVDERMRARGEAGERIIESSVTFRGTYARALFEMGAAVVWAHGSLRPLQALNEGRATLFIVGYESDVRSVETLVRSLEIQAMVALAVWWKSDGRSIYNRATDWEKRQARRSMIEGFGVGAAAVIREAREEAVSAAGSGTELVLSSRRSRVDAAVDAQDVPQARERGRKRDDRALVDGYRRGREAQLGGRSLTQGRGLTG